jgi:hypothetical protein
VPIPVCYFAEDKEGNWEVIDGLQRVHSIVRFLSDKFPLRGLPVLSELNTKKFGDLPSRDQRRLQSRTLRFVVITEESHADIKFDVFERLNTGAVKLTPQELRNCIYRGTFNDALVELSRVSSFREALGGQKYDRMRKEEMVLRFIALLNGLRRYKPPLTQFLNQHMRDNRESEPSDSDRIVFEDTMRTISEIFGSDAFRMPKKGKASPNLNRALFDAVSLSIAFCDRVALQGSGQELRERHAALLESDSFQPLVGRATADRTRVYGRIVMYTDMIRDMGIASDLPSLSEQ